MKRGRQRGGGWDKFTALGGREVVDRSDTDGREDVSIVMREVRVR